MTRIYAREIVAYAARYGYLTQAETDDGTHCLVRFQPGCFDRWLAREPAGVKVVVNHGKQLNGDAPSLVLGEPVGTFTEFTADAVGLRTVAAYDATPLATETLAAIRDGVLTAYSLHARIADSKPTGQAREGLPIYDVTDAEVTEAGPTPDPADPNARILSAGGVELRAEPDPALEPASVLAYMSGVTGLDTGRALERIDQSKRHAERHARDQVRDAESLAQIVKRARRRKLVHRAEWQATGYNAAQDIARAAARVEAEALNDLRELLCNDTRLVNMVLRSAGVEP
jgi:HK97 family phage prohead protease